MRAEQVPPIVAGITLVGGVALIAAPSIFTGPVGLDGQDTAVRVVGLADLVLVPGLLRGERKWPWMARRAMLSVVQATYAAAVAPQARSPRLAKVASATLLGLSVMDAVTAMQLRRAGS